MVDLTSMVGLVLFAAGLLGWYHRPAIRWRAVTFAGFLILFWSALARALGMMP